ncbi:MAG: hypothetical protein JWO06_3075 [Bacteroidota bacterium]|nr:hypothetical protein [Bacteroidota bacterium]
MSDANNIINGLWIGNTLSKIELLTMRSFMANGHQFKLWVYDDAIKKLLPEGVLVADANEIIPSDKVFSYVQANKYGHGKGSYAGFSDIFRYRLLFLHGGWWVDMDVCCLKHFDFEAEYFFRAHHELLLVGNVMKCPKGSELMKACYEDALANVNEHNTDWHKPIEILCNNVKQAGLDKFIVKEVGNNDRWEETSAFILKRKPLPDYYFLHWQNEEWRWRMIDKNIIKVQSTLGELMQRYGLLKKDYSTSELLFNRFQFSGLYTRLKLLGVVNALMGEE